ncbi:MAG TPA: class I SAM-dependent methyltransferase [Acidimicrobiia bacterium]|nr:class I SAM-dependent methyltransferase [Acidimicrobiia bacterium]
MTADTTPDYRSVTAAQQETWSEGDFHEIARLNVGMSEEVCDFGELLAGERILDVACGSGTAALVAARRYCEVTGIDYVPALLDRARRRAHAEGLAAEFLEADAQRLPFADDSFDAALSVYGVQFAPDQHKAASEMLRVTRPGGRIVLASPMPTGWSGDFFGVHTTHNPPPDGLSSPLRWGTESGLEELLGHRTTDIVSRDRTALQFWLSVDHAVEVFWKNFGPTIRAAEMVGPDGTDALRGDLCTVFERYDRSDGPSAVVENTWRLTVATVV